MSKIKQAVINSRILSRITAYHCTQRNGMAAWPLLAFIVVNLIAAILIFGLPPFLPALLGPLLSPVTTGLFGPIIGPGAAGAILQSLITFPLLILFIRRGYLHADEIG